MFKNAKTSHSQKPNPHKWQNRGKRTNLPEIDGKSVTPTRPQPRKGPVRKASDCTIGAAKGPSWHPSAGRSTLYPFKPNNTHINRTGTQQATRHSLPAQVVQMRSNHARFSSIDANKENPAEVARDSDFKVSSELRHGCKTSLDMQHLNDRKGIEERDLPVFASM